MTRILFLILSAYSSLAFCETEIVKLPDSYHGIWDTSLILCEDQYSDSSITIEDNVIEYHESFGQIVEFITTEDNKIQVELRMKGEGLEWDATITYSQSEDGSTLIEHFEDGTNVDRLRCPETPD